MTRVRTDERFREQGHLMVGLMVAIAIMLIFSMVAFQAWGDLVRRDNEAEMIFRAQEIVRALQRYRMDHGGMTPDKLELLLEPGPKGQYYIRRLYKDPLVKDGKWGLLFVGPGGQILDAAGQGATNTMTLGIGAMPEGLTDQQRERRAAFAERQAAAAERRRASREARGAAPENPGLTGLGGGQVVGLPIGGVKSLATDTPFRIYKGNAEYAEWLFTYLDLDPGAAQGQPGQNPGQPGQPGVGGQPPGQPGQPGVRPPGDRGRDRSSPSSPRRPGGSSRRPPGGR